MKEKNEMGMWVCLLGCIAMGFVGCRMPTAPERVYERFAEALESQNTAQVWGMLSQESQARWAQHAKRIAKKTGKQLFLAGALAPNRALRNDSGHPPRITKDRATLYLLDDLNQRVFVELRYENKHWKIHLKGLLAPGN